MAHGVHAVFPVSMSSGATLSDAVDIGRSYRKMHIDLPSSPSGSVYVHVAVSAAATYRRIGESEPNHDTAFVINSSVAANGGVFNIPAGYRHMKIENTSGVTDATTVINVICAD